MVFEMESGLSIQMGEGKEREKRKCSEQKMLMWCFLCSSSVLVETFRRTSATKERERERKKQREGKGTRKRGR